MTPVYKEIPSEWYAPPSRPQKESSPFLKMVEVKEIFFWAVYYLDNQSVLELSRTCRFVRARMQTKDFCRKAAWSLSKGIPFDPLTKLSDLVGLYQRINVRFPKLILAFGSLQGFSEIPCINIARTIELHGTPNFHGRAVRGLDCDGKVFIAFCLKVKDPYRLEFKEQIEVIYCINDCWKRLTTGSLPHLTLGIAKLNDPEVQEVFTNRVKHLWSGLPSGIAVERPTSDSLSGKVPYKSSTISGPYSSYVTL